MSSFVVVLASAAACAGASLAGCGDDSTSSPIDLGGIDASLPGNEAGPAGTSSGNVPDAGQDSGPTDAGARNDSAADAGEAGAGEAGPGDAGDAGDGGDAQTKTNHATWTATAGLPSEACAKWTLVDSSAAHDPVLAGGVMTVQTDSVSENMYWLQSAADLAIPGVVELAASVRLVAGSSSETSRAPVNITVRYGDPLRTMALYIGDGSVFLNTADLTKGPTANVATTDAQHTYGISIDTTTHAITVKRDGTQILTGTTYLETLNGTSVSIFFGEASLLATGKSEWASFTHNAHALALCP